MIFETRLTKWIVNENMLWVHLEMIIIRWTWWWMVEERSKDIACVRQCLCFFVGCGGRLYDLVCWFD